MKEIRKGAQARKSGSSACVSSARTAPMRVKKIVILACVAACVFVSLLLAGYTTQAANAGTTATKAAASSSEKSASSASSASASASASASGSAASAATSGSTFTIPAWDDSKWEVNSDCTVCHQSQADTMTDSSCLASHHASVTCTTCHYDEDALITVHNGKQEKQVKAKRLKKTEVPSDVCLTCHKTADLIKATADDTTCTDDNGTTVNPHDIPDVEGHADIMCSDCHQMHGSKNNARRVCLGCHHQGVYECGTCHDYSAGSGSGSASASATAGSASATK